MCKPVCNPALETAPDTAAGQADTPAPSENNGHTTELTTVPDARRPGGQFAPGNQIRRTHGKRVRRPLASLEKSDLFRDWSRDLGDDITAAERAVLIRAAQWDTVADTAFHYLQTTRETLTSKRVQSAVLTLSTATGHILRAAQLLGLRRRARNVDPLQAVRDAVARANQRTDR